jgi:hypothetical protein
MTQAFNLSQLANNLDSTGRVDATDGLVNAVPVLNGGTGASSAGAARTNLNVPGRDGESATGTWPISISGNAATVTNGVTLDTAQTITGNKTFSTAQTFNGNINGNAQGRFISTGRDANDWNSRQILVQGDAAPGIGFHAPSTASAGIIKFWGASQRFEFRNANDSGFLGVTADSILLASCNEYAAARPYAGWVTLAGLIYNNTLPGGGTWAWFFGSGGGVATGINAGGTTLPDLGIYQNGWGFAWRFM